ncbi:multicopper oxidase family protein [Alkalihalobacillus sp. AL-G]|uniref:multicopper oxidase family protein n=1 Tax=Alkalihalobacillus sp. AL-G TaxID=2926399 RepID=UPI00272DC75C|nr:multicopper oxidase family protein [Alkalihalobacillus sp. AL-G]WLD92015.1 multicopper oxidase family protein [Alkalihalobacillus sp. AL-G]
MRKRRLYIILSLVFILFIAACSNDKQSSHEGHDMKGMEDTTERESKISKSTSEKSDVITKKDFTITANEQSLKINDDTTLPVWTFNGSVPGSEIRVTEGEKLTINLKNELPDPVTIHWHGVPVPNEMDGIPGVTMNAVQPGETFTYKFTAGVPGTYWYHSHQDGVNQVDKGLYGAFIVKPKGNKGMPDRDYTLLLDEWMSSRGSMEDMDHSEAVNHDKKEDKEDHSDMSEGEGMDMGHSMSMYDLYTINGKSGYLIEPLKVKKGEKVRLRLINAGFMSHKIHLHGHEFKVVSTDGQPINNPASIHGQMISIAPGERYDIEFIADNPGKWLLESHGDNNALTGMKTYIQYEAAEEDSDKSNNTEDLPVLNITKYGEQNNSQFSLRQNYDSEYIMDLNSDMRDTGIVYTINGNVWPKTDKIKVEKGDLVKVKLVNKSKEDDHPMHLHGHFFQILSKNDKPVSGSPIMKDTLSLKPGDEYIVAFEADNPGNWMFHCHDLHHASAGMVTQVNYKNYETEFVADRDAGNKPE